MGYLMLAGWPLGFLGVRGQVVDRDTGRPIPGGAVQWSRSVSCGLVIHSQTYRFRPLETRTDAAGRFWFWPDLRLPLCLVPHTPDAWVAVLAPGYRLDTSSRGGLVRLEPAILQSELSALAHSLLPERDEGPVWQETRSEIMGSVRPAAPPGVFVTVPGARFDQLVLLPHSTDDRPWLLFARDASTGRLHAWDGDGRPVALPLTDSGWTLLGVVPEQLTPLLGQADRLVFPRPPPARWRGPGSEASAWASVPVPHGAPRAAALVGHVLVTVEADGQALSLTPVHTYGPDLLMPTEGSSPPRPVGAVFPGASGPIDCLGPGVAVVRVDQESALYRFATAPLGAAEPARGEPLRLAPGALPLAVSACAASDRALYIAGRNGTVVALDDQGSGWRPRPGFHFRLPGPRRAVTGLGVTRLGTQFFAVAGDEHVYVFTRDGLPDQRVVLDRAR
jgi:hypothetical protein